MTMETVEQGKAALISGIERDARSEADAIINEAEKLAQERRDSAEQQVLSIIKDAEVKAATQKTAIEKKLLSGIDIEIKRTSMHIRDVLLKEILEAVEKKLLLMISDSSWRTVLLQWTVEAAIGLSTASAEINASVQERAMLDKTFCAEAEKLIQQIAGRSIHLSVSTKPPLQSAGVVVTADDGKTAFNNQIHTRMLRKQREIRKYIYEKMFPETEGRA